MFRCVDLHCHSRISDGVFEPAVLAQRAASRGVELWALTDHDEVSGIHEARQAAQSLGMTFLAGVEISVTWAQRTVHVVGLGVDETNLQLLEGLSATRSGRRVRAQGMSDKLAALGMPGAFEGALRFAGNEELLSRTHFARFLVEQGYCKTMQQVFDRYLGDDGIAYVASQWASLTNAVRWIKQAGGIAVLAHPGRYKYNDLLFDALFREFKGLGGEGIEVNTGSHRPNQYMKYAQIAREYGFMASCGSDFHGPSESRLDLGDVPALPADLVPVWHALGLHDANDRQRC